MSVEEGIEDLIVEEGIEDSSVEEGIEDLSVQESSRPCFGSFSFAIQWFNSRLSRGRTLILKLYLRQKMI